MDFRQYDPSTGRFYNIDLLAEATYSVTPYHFASNNPVIGSDPTGLLTFFNGMDHSQPKGIQGSFNGYGMINRFGNTEDSFLDNLHSGYGLDPSGGGAFPGSTPYGLGTGYSGGYQGHLDYAEGGHWLKIGRYLVENLYDDLTHDKYSDGFYRPSQDLILQYKNYYIWQPTSPSTNNNGWGNASSGWDLSFYTGVPIISTPLVDYGQAFTHGPLIISSPGLYPKTNKADRDLIRHEVGHVLTFIALRANLPIYLVTIAIPSVINFQTGLGGKHESFYAEKIANTFSEWVYGSFNDPTRYPSYNP